MRQRLNENPVVQVVMLGILGIIVAFMFMTRVMGGDEEVEPEVLTTTTTPATQAPPATSAVPTTPGGVVPAAPGAGPATTAGFTPGPGLPKALVRAHKGGDVVALLIVQEKGIEDKKLRAEVKSLRSRSDTRIFVSKASALTRFSRVAEGVDLDRVPALIVVHPSVGRQAPDALPMASISYGFRGQNAVTQAIRDALYDGKNLPYHPG